MNITRQQLALLRDRGLITGPRFVALSAQCTALGTINAPELTLQLGAPGRFTLAEDSAAGDGSLILTADTITRYNAPIEGAGLYIHDGALEARQPLSNVKMLRDHNHAEPVGHMLTLAADNQGATFRIAPSEAERVKSEFENKLRDGLSVGFGVREYTFDDDGYLHVHRADFYEVSLCAIPAVPEAGVSGAASLTINPRKDNTVNRAQLAAALAAGTITQEEHDASLATITRIEGQPTNPHTPDVPAALAAGPEEQPPAARQQLQVNEPNMTLETVVRRMTAAANTGRLSDFQLAISDVLPAADAGEAWTRPEWMAELLRADDTTRTWVNAIGTPQPMTAMKGTGWRFVTEPDVEEYAGDNTEVASGDVDTEAETFTGWEIAAGWGVARSLIQFADEEFTRSFWAATARAWNRKTNAGVRTRLLAAATAPGLLTTGAGGSASAATNNVTAFIKQLVRDVRKIEGGAANRIALGATQFGLLEDLPTDNLPLWLKSAEITLDITEATASAAGGRLLIWHDAALAANAGVAFDNRFATVKETPRLELSAIQVSHAKVDLGVWGAMRLDIHDPRVLIKRVAGEAQPS
jgi:HK97 family phage prohead protease